MRKIDISDIGNLVHACGRNITCPYNFGTCNIFCAWFSKGVDGSLTPSDGKNIRCKGHIIGKIGLVKYEGSM